MCRGKGMASGGDGEKIFLANPDDRHFDLTTSLFYLNPNNEMFVSTAYILSQLGVGSCII